MSRDIALAIALAFAAPFVQATEPSHFSISAGGSADSSQNPSAINVGQSVISYPDSSDPKIGFLHTVVSTLSAPTQLAPLAGGEVGVSYTYDWTSVEGALSYEMQISSSSDFSTIDFSTEVA